MVKGRKKDKVKRIPQITGCEFLDGVMPQTIQFYKSRVSGNLLVTLIPEGVNPTYTRLFDDVGVAIKYTNMKDFVEDTVHEIPNRQSFRLFVTAKSVKEYVKHLSQLLAKLKSCERAGTWLGVDLHVFISIPETELLKYAEDGILPEITKTVWQGALFGFIYNPKRQAYECHHSTCVPSLKSFHYPCKIKEPEQL